VTGRTIDPEGAELAALGKVVDFAGLRVLEVGCGDGRLTWRYAHFARSVLATDPDESAIRRARRARPPELRGRVRFSLAGATDFKVPRSSFDLAFFSWSL
jgi:ubiquinone/menaquinone biosynthesis C-methylase UbiE